MSRDPFTPPRSVRRDQWTPEDLRLVTIYGACLVCGEPRHSELRDEGELKTWIVICSNGHEAR